MPQKQGQFSVADIMESSDKKKGQGQFSSEDLMSSKKSPVISNVDMTDKLDPGSVANIANPAASAFGQNSTSLPRAGLNLVGALGQGAEEGLGISPIDPNHPNEPVMNQIRSLPRAALGLAQSSASQGWNPLPFNTQKQGQAATELASDVLNGDHTLSGIAGSLYKAGGEFFDHPIDKIMGFGKFLTQGPNEMGQGIGENDPDKFIHGLGQTATTTLPAAMGLKEPLKNAYNNLAETPDPVSHPLTGFKEGLTKDRAPRMGLFSNEIDPRSKFPESKSPIFAQQGAQANGGDTAYWLRDRLEKAWQTAAPDLKQGEKDILHAPVVSAEEHYRLLPEVKNNVWHEYEGYLDKGKPISGDELVRRSLAQVDSGTITNHPTEYKALVDSLNEKYGGKTFTPRQIQDALSSLNSEAKAFYKQSNMTQASNSKLMATAKWEAPADAMRGMLDESLPQGGDQVRKRYGALSELQEEMSAPHEENPGLMAHIKKKFSAFVPTGAIRTAGRAGGAVAEHLTTDYSDDLIRKAYENMPSNGSPTTTPTTHPMSPRQVLNGNQPLAVPNHPMSAGLDINTGIQESQPQPVQSVIPTSQPNHPMTGLDVVQNRPPLANIPSTNPVQASEVNHPMTGLNVNQARTPLPHEIEQALREQVQSSEPHSPIPTGLNTNIGAVMEPQTPLTHPLAGPLSKLGQQNAPVVPEGLGHDVNRPNTRKAPLPIAPTRRPYPQAPVVQPPVDSSTPYVSPSSVNEATSTTDVRYMKANPTDVIKSTGMFDYGIMPGGTQLQMPLAQQLKRLGKRLPTGLPKGK
jgi:hypothetical protein